MAGKKTIVVKIGTSSLTEKSGRLSPERLRALTAQVADLRDEGHQVVMVTSAAIAAGYTLLGYHERPVAVAAKQACAAAPCRSAATSPPSCCSRATTSATGGATTTPSRPWRSCSRAGRCPS